MATDAVTQTQILGNVNGTNDFAAGWVLSWGSVTGMANGDTGAPVSLPGHADRTMQVTGTFGSGGSVTLQGSNDGVNYYALNNPSGTAIAVTSAGIVACIEPVVWIRPAVTAGDGTTSLAVTVFARNQMTIRS